MHGSSIYEILYTAGRKEKHQAMNEKDTQQSANQFVTAPINTLGNGTLQDVVKKNFDEKNFDDAPDIVSRSKKQADAQCPFGKKHPPVLFRRSQ